MQITKDKVVSIDYTLRDPNGQVIDTSEGRQPLTYLHGNGNLVPGLEKALEGQESGARLKVKLTAEQAYGAHDPRMVQSVPRSNFQGVEKIEPGMQFQAQTPQGPRVVQVVKVDDQSVTVDANHPLAGVALNFDVKVTAIRDAAPDEIAHGHVHGPDGHHH